ncbi:uncharacterized protein EI97DRAFT_433591 [Westerdykella ornata]|uniref:Mediator of RNA polymerase II transcription subunit 16 n=1 Tax=Westerdykella ornata TaxID=318751 RepID=A0A6A6JKG2_WESOR|nr:uncharacterized protein EI97DRAFT_433591 [Westerdykella ornata]KAF2276186.1 hypothetical protein EI97DRAFT_433591 [Westerdykella ornata]
MVLILSRKIAWSNTGCVASISPDGYAVYLRVFLRDPLTRAWSLGNETQLDFNNETGTFQFVHLSWSRLGNDLVVVDTAGRVFLFTCQMVLGRMVPTRVETTQSESELDVVVGMHWLSIIPYEKKNQIVWSASRENGSWSFKTASHVFNDAHHPLETKASLIYLRRFGDLRLRYQQADSSWHEVSHQTMVVLSVRDAFSHAAFASNGDNTLLLAAYDITGRLHLYRIEVNWNVSPSKSGQPSRSVEKPELLVSKLATQEQCLPVSVPIVGDSNHGGPSYKLRIPAQLTHLHFLPTSPDQGDGTVPTIQAIFSTAPNTLSLDQTQPSPAPYSILVRWEVHRSLENPVDPIWDIVTSKKKNVSDVPAVEVFKLKRLPDTALHNTVISFSPLWYSMTLAYCYADGTIELRKRSTMDVLLPNYSTDTVTSLSQAGFTFPTGESSIHVALSPNHCIAACMQQDGNIKLRLAEYAYGSLSSDEEDEKHSAALAAIALQFASAANQYFSNDDLFAVLGPLTERRKDTFIQLISQAVHLNLDCSSEEPGNNQALVLLGRSPHFVKVLSAAHILGFRDTIDRTFNSKIAWIVLNIKYVTQILTTITRLASQDKNMLRPELVPHLVGLIRWFGSFMCYVLDALVEFGLDFRKSPPDSLDRSTLEAKFIEKSNPAVLLLLSSFPRTMMKHCTHAYNWVLQSSLRIANSSAGIEIKDIYLPLQEALSDLPFDWRIFDSVINEATAATRQCYRSSNTPDSARNAIERDLLSGRLPDVLFPAAKRLVTDYLWNDEQPNGCLADKFDMTTAYFADTRWLGFQDSAWGREWHAKHVVDVCQKVVIRGFSAKFHQDLLLSTSRRGRSDGSGGGGGGAAAGGAGSGAGASGSAANGAEEKKVAPKDSLRRCTRCAAYMEDVLVGRRGYSAQHVGWLAGIGKHCICGNAWTLVENPLVESSQAGVRTGTATL